MNTETLSEITVSQKQEGNQLFGYIPEFKDQYIQLLQFTSYDPQNEKNTWLWMRCRT